MSSGSSTTLPGATPTSGSVANSFANYRPINTSAALPTSGSIPAGSGGITAGLTGSLIGSSGMPALPTPGNFTRQTVAAPVAASKTYVKPGNTSPSIWNAMNDAEKEYYLANNLRFQGADR